MPALHFLRSYCKPSVSRLSRGQELADLGNSAKGDPLNVIRKHDQADVTEQQSLPSSKPASPAISGTILALDAAGHACSAALWRDGGLAAQERRAMSHGHAVELLPMIERVMAAGRMDLRQVERIAATVGPGGFTGLRIGLATARGLGLAIGCPVIGLSSFQVAAAALAGRPVGLPDRFLVVLDSRRAEPYAALLGGDLSFLRPPALMTLEEIRALIREEAVAAVIGDGIAALQSGLAGEKSPPALIEAATDAAIAAALAADPGHRFDLPPDPVYIRPPDISLPKSTP
jgi:tRNA threonylcarbamoyladenosine biosynthesis protein TsaB